MYFVYDSETTGFPDWNTPSDGPKQPHLVELAGLLCDEDEDLTVQSKFSVIIKPDGWVIPDAVAEIHDIDTEYAQAVGIPEKMALDLWWEFARISTRIGHNLTFDDRIMRIATKRYRPGEEDTIKDWPKLDTAFKSAKLVNLPPTDKMLAAGRKTPKTPTLEELFTFLFPDRPKPTFHGAWDDARATRQAFIELRNRGIFEMST